MKTGAEELAPTRVRIREESSATVVRNRVWFAFAIVLCALFGAQLLMQARHDTLTYDEIDYIKDGICSVHSRTVDPFESTNPPIFKIASGVAVTSRFDLKPDCLHEGDHYQPVSLAALKSFIFTARFPSVLVSVLLLIVVGIWTRAMFGAFASILAMTAIAFEPTLIGHGHLATGDIWISLASVAFLYSHWQHRKTGARWAMVLSGVALGGALLSKVTGLALIPVVLGIDLVLLARPLARTYKSERLHGALRLLKPYAIWYGAVALISFAVLWLPYLVMHHPANAPMQEYGLPGVWVEGLRYQLQHSRTGMGASNYINGSSLVGKHIPYYYVEALLLKSSPLLLVGLVAALFNRKLRTKNAVLWLLFPSAVFIAIPSAGVVHIGVRYVLVVFALFAMLAALGYEALWEATRRVVSSTKVAAAIGVAALLVLTAISLNGEGISYFNPIARSHPEKYLADSNLDWGQDGWRVRSWWEKHGKPPVYDFTFGRMPLSDYGVTVVDGQPCPDAVAVVSAQQKIFDKSVHVGRKIASITPAVKVYEPDCALLK